MVIINWQILALPFRGYVTRLINKNGELFISDLSHDHMYKLFCTISCNIFLNTRRSHLAIQPRLKAFLVFCYLCTNQPTLKITHTHRVQKTCLTHLKTLNVLEMKLNGFDTIYLLPSSLGRPRLLEIHFLWFWRPSKCLALVTNMIHSINMLW